MFKIKESNLFALIDILVALTILYVFFKLIENFIKAIIRTIKKQKYNKNNNFHNKNNKFYNNNYQNLFNENQKKYYKRKLKTNKLSPEEKGEIGETEFINYLNQDNTYYKKILRNIYIPLKDENYTEIDVLLICNFGIYVFEVKNYSGWIFGGRNQDTWTVKSINGKTYPLKNPINQNLYHLKHLENLINIKKYNLFKSIVIFVNGEIKSYIPNIDSNFILTKNDYYRLNRIIKESNIEILTNYEVDEIYEKVKFCTNVDEIVKLNHINKINYNKYRNKYKSTEY